MAVAPSPHYTEASRRFMEELLALAPGSQNGGLYANKPGYHNSRNNLWDTPGWENDYSTRLPADRKGPGDKAAGYDWTFPDAQAGNYTTILRYMDRIEAAFRARDPRLKGWREALGQADPDRTAEGFDFVSWSTRTPDLSHLWHIHLSELRQNTESWDNKAAMLSILRGESLNDWLGGTMTRDEEIAQIYRLYDLHDDRPLAPEGTVPADQRVNKLHLRLNAIDAQLAEIKALLVAGGGTPPSGPVELTDAAVEEIAEAVADEQAQRLAD